MLEPRVYVIDDEEAVRDSMALLLEARELRVQSFASGAEFLAVAASLPPGCVVTDMRMPGMDGLELLRRISESNLSLPVIVMTGQGEGSLAAQAARAGAIACIEKPFRADVLLDAVFSGFAGRGSAATGLTRLLVPRIANNSRAAVTEARVDGKQMREIADSLA